MTRTTIIILYSIGKKKKKLRMSSAALVLELKIYNSRGDNVNNVNAVVSVVGVRVLFSTFSRLCRHPPALQRPRSKTPLLMHSTRRLLRAYARTFLGDKVARVNDTRLQRALTRIFKMCTWRTVSQADENKSICIYGRDAVEHKIGFSKIAIFLHDQTKHSPTFSSQTY